MQMEDSEMPTRVFISWGGDLSRKLGEALRNWLPSVLQNVRPYFTPDDVEKGARWNTEIAKELESSDVGILCLTRDNTTRPWLLFEAGALSKRLEKSRVCTLLFNLDPADVAGPLTVFQSTRFNRDDFKRLVGTINNAAGDLRLDVAVLDNVFDMWWPELEAEVQAVMGEHRGEAREGQRTERDMLMEILELSRIGAARAAALQEYVAWPGRGALSHPLDSHLNDLLSGPTGSELTQALASNALRYLVADTVSPRARDELLRPYLAQTEQQGAPGPAGPET